MLLLQCYATAARCYATKERRYAINSATLCHRGTTLRSKPKNQLRLAPTAFLNAGSGDDFQALQLADGSTKAVMEITDRKSVV